MPENVSMLDAGASRDMEPPKDMDAAIARLSKNKCWVVALFMLTSGPGILNSMHISSYVFLAENPTVWCDVPELEKANWTKEQIRIISMPDLQAKESCMKYNWDYSYLGQLGYNKSFEFINRTKKPGQTKCNKYSTNETKPSVVSEWNLVCEHDYLKPFVHASVAFGKLIGAFLFGIVADKYGRKKSFISSCIIYMVAGPAAAFVPYFSMFLILRIFIGIAGAGVYESGYTILTEMTVKRYRTSLGIIYNISYSFGMVFLPALAYASKDWHQLQLFISLPAFIFVINCFFLPESPRWLTTQGRYDEASKIIKADAKKLDLSPRQSPDPNEKKVWYKTLFSGIHKLSQLFSNSELRNRLLICHLCWFTSSLCYFVIAFNSVNFSANVYIYTALNGVVEAPGYIVPLIVLNFIGRKLTAVLLFFCAGCALLLILVIPTGLGPVVIALFGRFCISAVYAVVILLTSELFPTSHRNTAIGTSLTLAQLGTMTAPFIVDLLGKRAWYLPSTICGTLCVLAGASTLLLPETWNRPLPDTVQDINSSKRKVSIKNSFNFS